MCSQIDDSDIIYSHRFDDVDDFCTNINYSNNTWVISLSDCVINYVYIRVIAQILNLIIYQMIVMLHTFAI